jgi:Raf kinase inhibitor-like YbhB/YbcL family protein
MRRKVTASCLCVLATVATACNDDGRTLRDPGPGQTGSVSTTAAPTTIGPGEVDGGLVDSGALLPAASGTPAPLTAPWRDGAEIDPYYTCDGADVSPALVWGSSPEGTVEVAVTLTDLDQPDLVHWVMTGLDPARTTLAEGEVPVGAVRASNDLGIVGYSGPCNDPGTVDRYQYTVHFLSQQMEFGEGDPGRDVRLAVNSATFSSAQVVGLYSRY